MAKKKKPVRAKKKTARHASELRRGDKTREDILAHAEELRRFAGRLDALAARMEHFGFREVSMDGVMKIDAACQALKKFSGNLEDAINAKKRDEGLDDLDKNYDTF